MIDIDLQALAVYLTKNELWEKPISEFKEWEIRRLCEVILEATADTDGRKPPFLNEQGELMIPFKAPPIYRFWQGGQSVANTLAELGAPFEVARKYVKTADWKDLTPEEWAERLKK